ncbi:type II toxin-antitoxin system YafQ family toxin [Faucicola mancuniensis]|uniref:type II toxin-antitoxin system YafQ family toxin n=1 Tax=Faucicola mancuniensis TaxID=1309795 RepID=UPI0039779D44
MRMINLTSQFKRDCKKHYLALVTPAWAEVFAKLLNDEPLPQKYHDHPLKGDLQDLRDCHIQPDLILLYRKYDNVLELVRLGSHSELVIV